MKPSTLNLVTILKGLGVTLTGAFFLFKEPVLFPAVLTLLLAWTTRNVLVSLGIGIVSGVWLTAQTQAIQGLFPKLMTTANVAIHDHIIANLNDADHLQILLFVFLMGSLLEIWRRVGLLESLATTLRGKIKSKRGAEFTTFGLGCAFFLDDYANTALVGTIMKPVCDTYKVSRAKLAFLIDSTSAPIASLALLSTWVGFELSLIKDHLPTTVDQSPWALLVQSLPYRFYAWGLLFFIALVIWMQLDFGPMANAKALDDATGPDSLSEETTRNNMPWKSTTPILFVVSLIAFVIWRMVAIGMTNTGLPLTGQHLLNILSETGPNQALLEGVILALLFQGSWILCKGRALNDMVEDFFNGMKPFVEIAAILTLAWSFGGVVAALKTSDRLVEIFLAYSGVSWLPLLVFVLAALVSLASGSSWGTMALLFPLILPMFANPDMATMAMTVPATIGAILTGAIFGDHVSPISDTTILSATWSGCSVAEHVNTQMPYATLVALLSAMFGYALVGLGVSPYIGLLGLFAGLAFACHWIRRHPRKAAQV